mgnify:CR=1 FL=1
MNLNKRIHKLDILDLGEIKWASLVGGLLLAKLLPISISLPWYVYVLIILLLILRPMKHFFKI